MSKQNNINKFRLHILKILLNNNNHFDNIFSDF